MAASTTAELTAPAPFPDEPGEPIWSERRTVPIVAFYGVPLAFLVAGAVGLQPLGMRIAAAVLAAVIAWRLVVARRRAWIETYAVSDRFLTIVQPGGGRVALPIDTLRRVTASGYRVRVESTIGVVSLGFVRGQKAMFRALDGVAPASIVDREIPNYCPT